MESTSEPLIFRNIKRNEIDIEKLNREGLGIPQKESDRCTTPGTGLTWDETFKEIKYKGLTLASYREKAQNTEKPKGILFLLHGMGSYSNRNVHLAKEFSKVGYEVLAYDHRGCGLSEGMRGYTVNKEDGLGSTKAFIQWVDSLYDKSIPRFAWGQSMGGALAILASLEFPEYFKGLILFAPALLHSNYKKGLKSIGNFVGKLFPTFAVPFMKLNPVDSCRNPQSVNDILNDPLVYKGGFRPGSLVNVNDVMNSTYPRISEVKTPFIVVQGGHDKLVDPLGAFDLYEKAATEDKELLFLKYIWHDISHEKEIDDIMPLVIKWTISHTPS